MKVKWTVAGVMAATLLLAACGGDDLGSANDRGGDTAQLSAASTPATGTSEKPAGIVDTTAGTGTSGAPLPALDPSRKIVFTATMALNAADVGKAFSDASSLATGNGGYIEKSTFSNDATDNAHRSATLTIRVPEVCPCCGE